MSLRTPTVVLSEALREALEGLYEWADKEFGTREGLHAEWECEYPRWHEIVQPAEQLIVRGESEAFDEETVQVLLDALARDNESEGLARQLSEHPRTLRALLPSAVLHPDPDARWQIAVSVGRSTGIGADEAEEVLSLFRGDTAEYVRRRAMLALAERSPSSAMDWARDAWGTDHEYQRLAALDIAWRACDPCLSSWIESALIDHRQQLRAYAERLRSQKAPEGG